MAYSTVTSKGQITYRRRCASDWRCGLATG
jgi:hypothetical protein